MDRQIYTNEKKRLSLQIPVSPEEEKRIKDYIKSNNLKTGGFVKALILNEISQKQGVVNG